MNDTCVCDHVADEHTSDGTGLCLVAGCPCFAFEAAVDEEEDRAVA